MYNFFSFAILELMNTQKSLASIQSSLRDRSGGGGRASDSEFSTPRKYTWDYGADLGIDENEGQFISTRRDLTLSGGRQAPEGKGNQVV